MPARKLSVLKCACDRRSQRSRPYWPLSGYVPLMKTDEISKSFLLNNRFRSISDRNHGIIPFFCLLFRLRPAKHTAVLWWNSTSLVHELSLWTATRRTLLIPWSWRKWAMITTSSVSSPSRIWSALLSAVAHVIVPFRLQALSRVSWPVVLIRSEWPLFLKQMWSSVALIVVFLLVSYWFTT